MLRLSLTLAVVLFAGGCANAELLARQAVGGAVPSGGTDYETSQGQSVRFPMGAAAFADRAVSANPRVTPVPSEYGTTGQALRAPDDQSYTLGHGGSLTLEFVDNTLADGPGADLVVFEIGPDIEAMFVEISEDGTQFVRVGRIGGSETALDISRVARAGAAYRFVRLIDDPDQGDGHGTWPGADVDAVGAIHGQRR